MCRPRCAPTTSGSATGHQRGIDDDGFLTSGAPVNFGVPPHEFPLSGATDAFSESFVDLRRDLPPERGPKRPAFHGRQLYAAGVERNRTDFEHGAFAV